MTRKNARGTHNGDTARNAAVIWTVTGTAQMVGLNTLTYLHRLPRRMRTQRRQAADRPGTRTVPALERQPRTPPHLGTASVGRINPRDIASAGVAAINRSRRQSPCPLIRLPKTYAAAGDATPDGMQQTLKRTG